MLGMAAAALFVKNEQHDIMGWISWYFALGFKKIYIYDDHSTDGTYEICEAAAKFLDISLQKTNLSQENFYFRQRDSYYDACSKSSGHFKWIFLVDADEYLSLDGHSNIDEFLSNFDDSVSGIALNWKIYGSSGRVIKDNIPIVEAYLYHSDKNLNDNTLVKSIIKPERISDFYENPHKINFTHGVYVDASGKDFEWKPGATKDILWEKAWVNHYICRSMEHYADRIKRRIGVDLSNTTAYWEHFNKNDIRIDVDETLIEKCHNTINLIKSKTIDIYNKKIMSKYKNVGYPFLEGSCIKNRSHIYNIESHHGMLFVSNNIDGHIVQGIDGIKICALIDEKTRTVFLFRMINNIISNIKYYIFEDNRKNYIYKFNYTKNSDGSFSLKSTESGKYLTALPKECGSKVEASRVSPNDWEKFYFKKSENYIYMNVEFNEKMTSDLFEAKIAQRFGNINTNEFIFMFDMLSDVEKKEIVLRSNGSLSWLL